MLMRYLIPFIFTITLFTACEVVSEVERLEDEPQLVVNSIIHPDTMMWVHVTNSNPIFNQTAINPIKDAGVTIMENGSLEHKLTFQELRYDSLGIKQSFYVDRNQIPKEGASYEVTVESPTLGQAKSAVQLIPPEVPLQLSDFSIDTVSLRDRFILTNINATLGFQDNPETTDYYALSVFRRRDERSPILVSGIWSKQFFSSRDVALLDDGTQDLESLTDEDGLLEFFGEFGAVFSDATFDGKFKEIEIKLSPLSSIGENNTTKNFESQFRFELKHISRDLYLYAKSILEAQKSIQISNVTLPFSEPVKIYSNIEGGQGIFGAYNGYSVIYDVKEQRVIDESGHQ